MNLSNLSFPNEEILDQTLNYKGKQYTIHEHLSEIEKYYQHKTIFLKENNDLFFARQCVLVEGPADKYAIEVLVDFDLGGTSVIPCYGKDKLFYYQMICRTFGIPYFTLFDLDDDKPDDEPNKTIIEASHNNDYYHFASSLENHFGITTDKYKASKTMLAIDNTQEVKGELLEAFEKISLFLKECSGAVKE